MLNTNSKYLRWIGNTSAKKITICDTLICKQRAPSIFLHIPLQVFLPSSIVFLSHPGIVLMASNKG